MKVWEPKRKRWRLEYVVEKNFRPRNYQKEGTTRLGGRDVDLDNLNQYLDEQGVLKLRYEVSLPESRGRRQRP